MKTANPRPRLQATTPLLVVNDLQRSVDFYLSKLGFVEPAIHGEPPCFAMMNRDGFDLMLSLAGPDSTGRANGPDGTWDLCLRVADLEAEIAALTSAGIAIVKGPTDTFYAMREIEVIDPDGHRLCLAQDMSREPTVDLETWAGTLDFGSTKLRLELRLGRNAEGGLVAKLDSLDQNAMNLPVDLVVRDGTTLRFEMRAIDAKYEGTPEGSEFLGQWTQRGGTWPLILRRK